MEDTTRTTLEQINRSYQLFDGMYHEYAAQRGLSDCAFWILYALCESERSYSQNDFCEDWHFTKQTVHSAAAKLSSAGLLSLSHSPGSRNRKDLSLTEEGRAFADETIEPLRAAEYRSLSRLSEEERAEYVRLTFKHLSLLGEELERI